MVISHRMVFFSKTTVQWAFVSSGLASFLESLKRLSSPTTFPTPDLGPQKKRAKCYVHLLYFEKSVIFYSMFSSFFLCFPGRSDYVHKNQNYSSRW